MSRVIALLLGILFAASISAQEPATPAASPQDRQVTVTLNDGKVVTGKVVAMDLSSLQVQAGEFLVTIAATDIRTCHFDDGSGAPLPAAAPTQPPPVAPVAPAVGAETKGQDAPRRAKAPLPDITEEQELPAAPHERARSRLQNRLASLDEAFPWLVPSAPVQWMSLGLLLFACLSLIAHLSTSVVGAEANAAGRSMALAGWYLVTTFLQVALVPTMQLTTFIMLIVNPALALFWLRNLFGLTRGAAVIAFAVQLGFVLLGYGLLELVTSLLGSIGTGSL